MDLVEFLRARIDEDEQAAQAATHYDRWEWTPEDMTEAGLILQLGTAGDGYTSTCVACFYGMDHVKSHPPEQADADHIVRWDPARVLAECEAKRRIADRHSECEDVSYGDASTCPDLRDLASVYADHPDYRDDWRP